MSLKIVQEGLTENPLSVPMSVPNPETQIFIEGWAGWGGGGTWGTFFIYTIHVSRFRLYWQPLSLKTYHVGVQTPK